jgi:hypothetical protein
MKRFHFGFLLVLAATPVASARNAGTAVATLTGTCTKVILMDVVTDPVRCADTLTNYRLPHGRREFAFVVSPQGESKPAVMSFYGATSRQNHHRKGDVAIPVYRVYIAFDGRTVDLAALGSCVLSDLHKETPNKVSCSANTIGGNFAGEFIGNGIAPKLSLLQ